MPSPPKCLPVDLRVVSLETKPRLHTILRAAGPKTQRPGSRRDSLSPRFDYGPAAYRDDAGLHVPAARAATAATTPSLPVSPARDAKARLRGPRPLPRASLKRRLSTPMHSCQLCVVGHARCAECAMLLAGRCRSELCIVLVDVVESLWLQ